VISRARWLVGWGLIASTYLSLAVVRVAGSGDWSGALVYLAAAAITFGFAAAVMPVVVPRAHGDDSSQGEGGTGGEPPPPPWWPSFERQFWWHVHGFRGPGGRPEEPRERTPA
jgi:hypothetical protein